VPRHLKVRHRASELGGAGNSTNFIAGRTPWPQRRQHVRKMFTSRVRFLNSILPARRYASAGTSYGPCLSQVGVLSKWMDGSRWFLASRFFRPILDCVVRKFGYLQNKGTSFWNFAPKTPDFEKFLLLYIDRRNVLST